MKTIGAKIDKLHALREQKRALEKSVEDVKNQMSALELELMAQMDSEGVTRSTGTAATVSLTSSVKPSVEDWELFYKYIHRNKYYHLLERRPAVLGCREILEKKGSIPGIVPYTQRSLSVRSI